MIQNKSLLLKESTNFYVIYKGISLPNKLYK